MALRKIVGIDAGYVNFAVCGIATNEAARPYYWVNEALFKGEFSEEKLVHAIFAWINRPAIRELLTEADEIILERQMTMKYQAVNHCVRFLYFAKTREVHPNTIRAFFRLPEKRSAKKKAAVDLVSDHAILPVKKGKKDDLADAYLLAMFGAIESQPWLGKDWQVEQKKRKVLDCT